MTRRRRILLFGAGLAVVALGGLVSTWLYIGRPGSTRVEDWIGRHLVSVIEHHITPQVSFATLDYQRPRTVVLHDLRLVRGSLPMIAVDRMMLNLAEVPREGQPVQIERIELDKPRLVFAADREGRLEGWSDFVRPNVQRDPESVPSGQRLSDVLVLRHVRIRDGEIRYQAADDPEPMTLPGINLTLDTPPDSTEPGWYGLIGTLEREPVLKAGVRGRVNLDTGVLELAETTLSATLGEEEYAALPPRVQELLRRHRVSGSISARYAGTLPINEPASAKGQLEAELKDARLALGTSSLSVVSLKVESSLPAGPLRIEASGSSLVQNGRTLFSADAVLAELPSIPRGEWPIEVSRLELDKPFGELIADPEGGFVGWNELGGGARQQEGAESPAAATRPAEAAHPPNPYARVQKAEVRDGRLAYAAAPGDQILTLQSINLNLRPPEGRGSRQQVVASARSEGLLLTTLAGELDLDDLMLSVHAFQLRSQITGEPQYALLPEAIGSLFRRHGMTGELSFEFRGEVPFTEFSRIRGTAGASLRRTNLHFAGLDMPVEEARFEFDVPAGAVRAELSGLRMANGDFPMAQIRRAEVELAGPPGAGEPLEVRSARVEDPQLNFVQETDGSLRGWRNLMDPDTPWPRVSDFARFGEVQITNGRLFYQDLGEEVGESDPMLLSGIDMILRTPPIPGAPGWYRLVTSARHEPLFRVDVDGRINPDAMLLDMSRLSIEAVLGERQYEVLPPRIQAVLRRHEVRGQMNVTAKGRVPLLEPADADIRVQADFRDAYIAYSKIVWPIRRVQLDTTMAGRRMALRYDADLLGGQASGDVTLELSGGYPLTATWNVAGMQMEDTLRVVSGGPPKYAGRLASQGSLAADLRGFPDRLSGRGTLRVSEGRLVRLPVIRTIVDLGTLGQSARAADRATASFTLHPDHVGVQSLQVDSATLGLRMNGRINYTNDVDLHVQANMARQVGEGIGRGLGQIGGLGGLNPLHREFERLGEGLGQGLGEAANLVAVGERMVNYRVRGPLSQPQVTVVPGLLRGAR